MVLVSLQQWTTTFHNGSHYLLTSASVNVFKMQADFSNKVVLITGASSGIGEATATLFANFGAQLVLVGRNEGNLGVVCGRCEGENGNKPLLIVADLSTDDGVERTVELTLKHFGRVDVLINNAGITARTTLSTTTMGTFDQVFGINVRAVYNLTRLLTPSIIRARGTIVNVSSVAGSAVIPGTLPYGMAKAALDHFTRLVAVELAPKGVRVNAVSPGITVSNNVKTWTGCREEQYQGWLEHAKSYIPLGEVCEAEDVARMVVHLAGDSTRLVTGTVVPVDGGLRFGMSSDLFASEIK